MQFAERRSNKETIMFLTVGTGLASIQADSNPAITAAAVLASGANIALSQSGNQITVAATGELSQTLTNTHIFVGNASNVATDVAMSGAITITNTGATAIQSNVITNAMINSAAAIAHSKMAALTANRATVTDGSGFIGVSAVTATELGYSSGVTSAIQTQLDGKQPTLGYTAEDVANKSTDTSLGTSDTLYPSQNAVKSYVDAHSASFPLLAPDGVANAPSYSFTSSTVGMYTATPGQLNFAAGNAELLRIDAVTSSITTVGSNLHVPLDQSIVFEQASGEIDLYTDDTIPNELFLDGTSSTNLTSTEDFTIKTRGSKVLNFGTNNVVVGEFDSSTTAHDTRFLLWDVDAGALVRVSVGAANSGGTGFKVLRVPN